MKINHGRHVTSVGKTLVQLCSTIVEMEQEGFNFLYENTLYCATGDELCHCTCYARGEHLKKNNKKNARGSFLSLRVLSMMTDYVITLV